MYLEKLMNIQIVLNAQIRNMNVKTSYSFLLDINIQGCREVLRSRVPSSINGAAEIGVCLL